MKFPWIVILTLGLGIGSAAHARPHNYIIGTANRNFGQFPFSNPDEVSVS